MIEELIEEIRKAREDWNHEKLCLYDSRKVRVETIQAGNQMDSLLNQCMQILTEEWM